MKSSEMHAVGVRVTREGGGCNIALSGRLDASTLPRAWADAVEPTRRDVPKKITVDVSDLSYCDGAGLGLFAELRRLVSAAGGQLQFAGTKPEMQRFFEMSLLQDPLAGQLIPPKRPGSVTQLGKATWLIVQDVQELITFTGQLLVTLLWAIMHPFQIRVRDMLTVAVKAGVNATPVVCLLGLLIGLILAFQTASPLQRFGAQPLIPTIVSISVIREMGPLITAVILAGRSGSAFAAEIGTMQVTEELAALKTLGLEPVRFLVIPRVLASIIVTPLLTVFNIFMSLLGGYVVMASLGYSFDFYVNAIKSAVTYGDFIGGVAKSLVFAVIVAGIGCLRGIQTKSGPGAVGHSTTRAVVAGIVLCIVADAILGVVYYCLGI